MGEEKVSRASAAAVPQIGSLSSGLRGAWRRDEKRDVAW